MLALDDPNEWLNGTWWTKNALTLVTNEPVSVKNHQLKSKTLEK